MAPFARLVLASNNAGKLREFRRLLAPLGIEVMAQAQLGIAEAEEPHRTFVENALAKARHASALRGCRRWPTIPASASTRSAARPACRPRAMPASRKSDARNNEKLLAGAAGVADRRAHYYCVLVLVRHADDPQPIIAEGDWHGEIIDAPRGDGGFGYDPHFLDCRELGCTGAELPLERKNALSHRGQALRALMERLQRHARATCADVCRSPLADVVAVASRDFTALPPLSLYVHIPWCVRKCPYCDFNSHEARGERARSAIRRRAARRSGARAAADLGPQGLHGVLRRRHAEPVSRAQSIDRLLAAFARALPLPPDAEITLEANPGTFERDKFAGFRDAGVNRLSLGIQSFDHAHLQALGRIHDARRSAPRGRDRARASSTTSIST